MPLSGSRHLAQTTSPKPRSIRFGRVEFATRRGKGFHCRHDLSIYVELQLLDGGIADAYWMRVAVSTEMDKLTLTQLGTAVNVVENIQARPRQTRGVQQPLEVLFRFG